MLTGPRASSPMPTLCCVCLSMRTFMPNHIRCSFTYARHATHFQLPKDFVRITANDAVMNGGDQSAENYLHNKNYKQNEKQPEWKTMRFSAKTVRSQFFFCFSFLSAATRNTIAKSIGTSAREAKNQKTKTKNVFLVSIVGCCFKAHADRQPPSPSTNAERESHANRTLKSVYHTIVQQSRQFDRNRWPQQSKTIFFLE